jgi:hypothetical protein
MIRLVLTAFFLGSAACFTAIPVIASDIFVDNVSGDDRRDGSSPGPVGLRGGPCRTIARALQLATGADRVIIAKTDQPYRESITIQAGKHSGTLQKPFELIGNGATLDGSQPIPITGWEHVRGDIFRFRPTRMSHQILYLGQRPALRRPTERSQGLPPLEPLEWCLYERHIYFCAEAKKMPADYDLSCTHMPMGITLYEVRHVMIRDLVIQGFQLDGLNAHDNVFFCTLQDLTCRGNGRSGISIGGASRVQAFDCLVGDNGVAQVRTEGHCKAKLVNCELLDKTAPGLVKEGGEVFVSTRNAAP